MVKRSVSRVTSASLEGLIFIELLKLSYHGVRTAEEWHSTVSRAHTRDLR